MRQVVAFILCGMLAFPAHAGGRRFFSSSCNSVQCATTNVVASHHVNAVAVAAVPIVQTIPLAVDLQAYQYTINPTVFTQQVQSASYAQAQAAQGQDAFVEQVAARVVSKLKVEPDPQSQSQSTSSQPQSSSIVGETGGLLPFSRLPPEVQEAKYLGVDVMKAHCAQCHTGATAKKGFVMFDDDGKFVGALDYSKVHQRISSDDPKLVMPPSGKLSAEQLRSVYDVAVPNGVSNPFSN